MPASVGVGVVGAGTISEQYLRNLTAFRDLDVRFVADLDASAARAKAEAHGIGGSGSVDDLLRRDDVSIVVNLTIPAAHADVSARALDAERHVWSEKPIALTRRDADHLLALARRRGVRLAVAPDTILGPGVQTARRLVASGAIGTPLTASTVFQTAGPESWHPNPAFLFAEGAGPLFDMGPYYVSTLVQFFGPVARVSAASSTARDTRTIGSGALAGTSFPVRVPTFVTAILEFADGGVAECTFSFQSPRQRVGVFEIDGSAGSLTVPDPNRFDGEVEVWREGAQVERVVTTSPATRGLGVLDLARSVAAGVAEQATGELGLHVIDVLESITSAAREHRVVEVESRIAPSAPLPAEWDPFALSL